MELNSKSLVADYDSSSEDENSIASPANTPNDDDRLAPATEMLNQTSKEIPHSVFTNPYKEIESYENSILEKHVKMTTNKEVMQLQVKPCYKFFKGKCKLGESCKFSHCNPIQNTAPDIKNDSEENGDIKTRTKKRCGLKNDLVPPKKFMKTYNKMK
ncbi:uncharacterized protein [Parasteatoda tepidariorum]|uniref:uncharacterized protein n=1 Tax=Parasteatoda tepidariorum TaxID=114398 RepID=UPI00077FD939|nr:uncharacterized protein LOC107451982 [Parasteatoda tepidariorum]